MGKIDPSSTHRRSTWFRPDQPLQFPFPGHSDWLRKGPTWANESLSQDLGWCYLERGLVKCEPGAALASLPPHMESA